MFAVNKKPYHFLLRGCNGCNKRIQSIKVVSYRTTGRTGKYLLVNYYLAQYNRIRNASTSTATYNNNTNTLYIDRMHT